MTAPATMLPLGIALLQPDALPCASCGQAVTAPTERIEFRSGTKTGSLHDPTLHETVVEMTRCQPCQQRFDLAGTLLDQNAGVRHAIGSRSVGVHRVSGALDALAVLGLPMPRKPDARWLWTTVGHLAAPGLSARWSRRFFPYRLDDAALGTCATEPWAAVSVEGLAAIRRAAAETLAERVDRLVTVPCPSGGCLLCGVESVEVMHTRARDAWRSWSASVAALGGSGLGKVEGHVCLVCQTARDDTGSVGPALLDAAVLRYLAPGQTWAPGHEPELHNVEAWAVRSRKPASEPWGHLDLDALREQLKRGHF